MEYRGDAMLAEMSEPVQDMSGMQVVFPFIQCFLYGAGVVIVDFHAPKSPFNVRFILRIAFAVKQFVR